MTTPQDVILSGIQSGEQICLGYLQDLTDEELLLRPHPKMNHINWQVGHLISSENEMINSLNPQSKYTLPESFIKSYTRETQDSDDASQFASKDELLKQFRLQRDATIAALKATSIEDLGKATGIPYAPTVAEIFLMQSTHWVMHSGQWVVVRRQMGKPPLF